MASDRRDSGFSLIELMTTVAILGILAAIAIPVLANQKAKAAHAAAANDLRALQMAQEAWLAADNADYTDDVSDLESLGYSRSGGVQEPVLRVTGGSYLACVTHDSLSEWLVFDRATGDTVLSSTNDCL